MADNCTEEVKVYPALFLAASRGRCDRLLRAWLLVRHMDGGGSGCVRVRAFEQFIRDHRLKGMANVRRMLASGDGLFWDTSTDVKTGQRWIILHSLERVGLAISERDPLSKNPFAALTVLIPLRAFRQLSKWRAVCTVRALHRHHRPGEPVKPRSKRYLGTLAGRSGETIRRYHVAERVQRIPNHEIIREFPDRNAARFFWSLYPNDERGRHFYMRTGTTWTVCRILANSYNLAKPTAYGQWGQSKHIARRHRAVFQTTANYTRRYYTDPQRAAKSDKWTERYLYAGDVGAYTTVQQWDALPCAA